MMFCSASTPNIITPVNMNRAEIEKKKELNINISDGLSLNLYSVTLV